MSIFVHTPSLFRTTATNTGYNTAALLSPDETTVFFSGQSGVIALNTKGTTLSNQGSGIPYGGRYVDTVIARNKYIDTVLLQYLVSKG